jgi:hypothetical protein
MLKINVSYCRKDGRANYGSEGASCTLEAELSSDTGNDALRGFAEGLYKTAKQLVEEQLADGAGEPQATPARPQRPEPLRNGNRYPGRSDIPRDGRQLLGWLRKQSNQSELMSLAHEIAMRFDLPGRFLDLAPDEVATLYDELIEAPTQGSAR